jgi:curli biogenesis system outer membrane secretion channel CsgG
MAGRGFFLTVFALLALAAPSTLSAQAAQTAAAPDEASIRALAALHVELNVARDEFNNDIAAIHEVQAQQEARNLFNNKVAEILTKHRSTELEYQQKIFSVSTDGASRTLFDRLVREAAEAGPAEG